MATTETVVDATVADTFRVLSTAHLYPEWVVGANATARGTRVVMDEGPGDLASRLVFNPLADLLLRGRNVEALRRLKRIVETRAGTAPTRA
ncbi:hypothetical protein GKE82_19245 [Conexibacter sp. W3-3-2]|uniref:hypothetical protein n=1 Tax=Conexibacter sp. W3-3-2 TaxID=2675227 RepID=UPI0012B99F6F|nr:hypothetical protein [Conexibacter sp. W3-3-2]MTD46363.1 hypothetical protein [Conexibacter sp. W3-3-2]